MITTRHISSRAYSRLDMMIVLAGVFMLFISCSSCTTKPKTGGVSGNVRLVNDSEDHINDPVDYSGITVALYQPVTPDTTMSRINSQYAQIGVPISQRTEFDHRFAELVMSTQSGYDGSFSLEEIDPGEYVLVLLHELWGVRYIHDIMIEENTTFSAGTLDLWPLREFSSYEVDNVTIKSGHSYLITGDASFVGEVLIEPQAQIFVNPGSRLKFYANVISIELSDISEASRFVSAKNVFTTDQTTIGYDDFFSVIEFNRIQISVSNLIIRHASTALALVGENIEVKDILIQNCGSGITIPGGVSSLSNVAIMDGNGMGIQILTSEMGVTEICNSVIGNMSEGISIYTAGSYLISNCYLTGNRFAIRPDNCTGTITHNAFDQNIYDIYQRLVITPTQIANNNFYHSKLWSIMPHRDAIINDNNFYSTDGYFVYIRDSFSPPNYSIASNDINAVNNYWKVTDIDSYLMDATDNIEFPNTPCAYYVLYNPRRSSPVSGAGII